MTAYTITRRPLRVASGDYEFTLRVGSDVVCIRLTPITDDEAREEVRVWKLRQAVAHEG